jgi:hypothetical protein
MMAKSFKSTDSAVWILLRSSLFDIQYSHAEDMRAVVPKALPRSKLDAEHKFHADQLAYVRSRDTSNTLNRFRP